MAPSRKRVPIARRRRLGDDEEDDEDTLTVPGNGSESDASIESEAEDDADVEESETEESVRRQPQTLADTSPTQLENKPAASRAEDSGSSAVAKAAFPTTADTSAMMAGLAPSGEDDGQEVLEFEGASHHFAADVPTTKKSTPPNAKSERLVDKRKRDHEEYKKQRDANPAFVPNRGGFFMHDQRSAPGSTGFGAFGGRGRGRNSFTTPLSNFGSSNAPSDQMNGTWAHDLHETVNESKLMHVDSRPAHAVRNIIESAMPRNAQPSQMGPLSRKNPFSRTTQTGTIQLRVRLQGMNEPCVFSGVPVKEHTRLPDTRPPLRRDKPVRISLPGHPPRYNFPKADRSFVFIPRAERPNQQGGRRSRPRGLFSHQGSRRTSAHGGSVYTPSVAPSRRSSRAQSPAVSVSSRVHGGPFVTGPPVVRLPIMAYGMPGNLVAPELYGNGSPAANEAQQPYPLPQDPEYRENRPGSIPMHQPRPQKTVSVAGIESPTALPFRPPQQQEQQPFHQQVPLHMNRPSSEEQGAFYPSHARQASHPSQASGGTPLSNIPERAIHAQPFHPGMMPQQAYYPAMYPPMYYYPPANSQVGMYNGNAMQSGAMYMHQPQSVPYMVPLVAPPPPSGEEQGVAPPGTMGHDGTTYFFDPSQAGGEVEGLTPASYAVPGMGGMMTPSPDGYFYGQMQQSMPYHPPQDFIPSR